MRILLLTIWIMVLPLTQFSIAPTPAAGPDEATMVVQAAFGGRFKFGEWLPIFVQVENNGPDLNGEIRVSMTNQSGRLDFVAPAELPAGARKRFTLYALPNNFSQSATVELVQDNDVLQTAEVTLSLLPNDRYVIGVAASQAGGLAVLSPPELPGRRERAEMISLTLENIPDRMEGLRLLNALILNDVDAGALTPDQQTALRQWVAAGGRLVVGGGAAAGRTLAGLPATLQPVALTHTQEATTLPALEEYTGEPIRVPGPFLVAGAQPVSGAAVLLSQQDEASRTEIPLIVELAVGAGYVDFVALDLTRSPFDAWAGVTDVAEQLLSPGAAWPEYMPRDISARQMSDSQMFYALSNLPALDLPSIRLLGFLLICYIILVGPLNYLFLRWRDRLAWAWVTIPALTLAFSALAYGLGFSLRGSDIIINQVSIMEMGPDAQIAQGRTYVGLFSPRRQSYDVEVAADTLIRPLGEGGYDPWSSGVNNSGAMSVVQSEPARVRGLAVNQWSMQSFAAETIPLEETGLEAALTARRDGINGQLVNQGDLTWRDVRVVFYGQYQTLGDIAPGQAVEINLNVGESMDMMPGFGSHMLFREEFERPTGPSRETTFKQSVLDSAVFNNNQPRLAAGPLLIGWLQDSPLQVRLAGEEVAAQKSSLLYGTLPLTFDGAMVAAPPGLSRIETLAMSGEAGPCNMGPGIEGYHIYQGAVETKLTLPQSFRHIQPDQLDLYIRTDGNWPVLPAIELYDQAAGQWVPLEKVKTGVNPIDEAERFYDPAGASLQLRISSDGANRGGCYFFDVALEGKRT